MKLIDRFISRELLVHLTSAVAVLSVVLVIGNVFRKLFPLLINHQVPPDYILKFVGYVLPFSLVFTIPWGLLTTILLVFGRLSADNEITAFRSNGVSISRICYPLAAVAIACTCICLWLNVKVAPATQLKMKTMILDLATNNPMALFGSDQVIDQFAGRKIYVGKKDGNNLENILVFELNEDSIPLRVIHARSGRLETDLNSRRILMHLSEARYQQRDEKEPLDLRRIRDGISMEQATLPISLEELYAKEKRRPGRSALTIEQLLEQINTGTVTQRSASRTEISKRFSFPLACLAFGLIGVPLGITAHRRETTVGFALALVVAFFVETNCSPVLNLIPL